MRINNPLLLRYARRLLGGRKELYSQATDSWSLYPEDPLPIPKARFLPSNLDLVRKISPWRQWENEKIMIHGGVTEPTATRCYEFKTVRIWEPYCYVGSCTSHQGFGREKLVTNKVGRLREIQEAQLVSTWSGCNFFGCLLLDDYPLELISETPAKKIRMISKPYSNDAGYRELLELDDVETIENGFVHKLIFYEDPVHSTYKEQRYRRLRASLARQIPQECRTGGGLIYVNRPVDGQRRLLTNVDELHQLITGLGFEIVDPGCLSPREISAKLLNAEIVMGIEGSHLSHAIFSMRETATLLVIQPPQRFSMVYKEFTDCLGMNFAFIVGDDTGDGDAFSVNLNSLQELLELC